MHGCSSLMESLVWLTPFLCVKRREEKSEEKMKEKREDERENEERERDEKR